MHKKFRLTSIVLSTFIASIYVSTGPVWAPPKSGDTEKAGPQTTNRKQKEEALEHKGSAEVKHIEGKPAQKAKDTAVRKARDEKNSS